MQKYLFSITLAFLLLIVEIITLPDYGINWDSPFRFLRGQAFVHYFLTGQKNFKTSAKKFLVLIKPGEFISRYSLNVWEGGKRAKDWDGHYFIDQEVAGHPPLIEELSVFYHNSPLLFSSIGIFIVAIFAYEITSSWLAALVAGVSLALFPFYFAESHLNIKDPVQASFFAGSIWAFWHWVKSNKLRWFGVFGVFVALALAVKWNIIFLPLMLLPWLFIIRKTEEFRKWFKLGRLGKLGGLGILGVFLFSTAIWPYLWVDPVNRLINVFKFYFEVGGSLERAQPAGFILPGGFNIFPILLLVSQTPEIILALIIAAIILSNHFNSDRLKTQALLLLWLAVPVIRQVVPHTTFYAGIRQFMEVLPVMAILAGIGVGYLSSKFKVQSAKWVIALVVFVVLLIPIIKYHPYENLYYNSLAGGFKGASQKNLVDWALDYGSSYKAGVNWLNDHAEKNSKLAFDTGTMFALLPSWLRSDIQLSSDNFSGFDQKGEYLMLRLNPLAPNVFIYWHPRIFLKPVKEIMVDGVAILSIYRNDPKFIKEDFKKEETNHNFSLKSVGSGVELDLGKKVRVTKLKLIGVNKECLQQRLSSSADAMTFLEQEDNDLKGGKLYSLNERKDLGNGEVEYWFPAVWARYIRIFPQKSDSCFISGRISSISFLLTH